MWRLVAEPVYGPLAWPELAGFLRLPRLQGTQMSRNFGVPPIYTPPQEGYNSMSIAIVGVLTGAVLLCLLIAMGFGIAIFLRFLLSML